MWMEWQITEWCFMTCMVYLLLLHWLKHCLMQFGYIIKKWIHNDHLDVEWMGMSSQNQAAKKPNGIRRLMTVLQLDWSALLNLWVFLLLYFCNKKTQELDVYWNETWGNRNENQRTWIFCWLDLKCKISEHLN